MTRHPVCVPRIRGQKYRFFGFLEIGPCDYGEVEMKGDYPRFKAMYTHERV